MSKGPVACRRCPQCLITNQNEEVFKTRIQKGGLKIFWSYSRSSTDLKIAPRKLDMMGRGRNR